MGTIEIEKGLIDFQPIGFLERFGELAGEPIGIGDYELRKRSYYYGEDYVLCFRIRGKDRKYGRYDIWFRDGKFEGAYYQGSRPVSPPTYLTLSTVTLQLHGKNRNITFFNFPGLEPFNSNRRYDFTYGMDSTENLQGSSNYKNELVTSESRQLIDFLTGKPKLNLGLVQVSDLCSRISESDLSSLADSLNLPEEGVIGFLASRLTSAFIRDRFQKNADVAIEVIARLKEKIGE